MLSCDTSVGLTPWRRQAKVRSSRIETGQTPGRRAEPVQAAIDGRTVPTCRAGCPVTRGRRTERRLFLVSPGSAVHASA